ncbi:MAG: hypothetical protein KGL48_05835 [Sphingomonadales bacterium]|nr:hypothetical protein [Sphingomonadales bacterium]MDE2569261.1 hypothetical protein [Sphingomonadales bacterium]
MALYNEIHIKPARSIFATSSDRKAAWAVTADERGLHIIVCMPSGQTSESWFIGPVRNDLNSIVKVGLVKGTAEASGAAQADGRLSAGESRSYRSELLQLNASLEPPLKTLIAQMRVSDPQFLDGHIHINMPATD